MIWAPGILLTRRNRFVCTILLNILLLNTHTWGTLCALIDHSFKPNETNKVTNEPDVAILITTRRTRTIIHELIDEMLRVQTTQHQACTRSVDVVVWPSLIGLKFSIQIHHVVDFVIPWSVLLFNSNVSTVNVPHKRFSNSLLLLYVVLF